MEPSSTVVCAKTVLTGPICVELHVCDRREIDIQHHCNPILGRERAIPPLEILPSFAVNVDMVMTQSDGDCQVDESS